MFKFPFSTMHELNLDWLIAEWQKFKEGFLDGFLATSHALTPVQDPTVAVTFDPDTNKYTFDFGIPGAARPTQTEIMYAPSSSSSTPPTTGWSANPPVDPPPGTYIWTRNKVKYNDNYEYTFYAVAYIGLDGYTIRRYEINVSSGTTSYTITDQNIDEDCALIDFYMSNPKFLESEIVCNTSAGSAVLTLTVSGSSTLVVDIAKIIH